MEKTFEELIEESIVKEKIFNPKQVCNLMKKVREATMVEAFMAIMKDQKSLEVSAVANKILMLPKDRILITENEE